MKKVLMVFAVLLLFAARVYAASGDLTVGGDLTVNGSFNMLPAGTITMYGASTAPTGWLLADGSAVSRTTYADLFTAIGTTYGAGDGSTTFNLPDFRGVFPKGAGTTNRSAGKDASGNYYSGTLGSYGQDHMQGHKHSSPSGVNFTTSGSSTSYSVNSVSGNIGSSSATGTPATDGTNGTPRTGSTTEPQSLGVAFIIKY